MAAPSPRHWRLPSNSITSPHSTSLSSLYLHKRRRIITYSSNKVSTTVRNRITEKSVNKIIIVESESKVIEALNSSKENRIYDEERLGFELLFGKRPFWRRISFASQKVRSLILLNFITIIYASNIPIVKEVEAIIDPEAFTVVRFVVAAIPFIPFVFQARGDVETRKAGMELGFWVSLGYILQALGLVTSDAGRASFITLFTVIVVPLIDGMLGAKIPAHTWFGAFMSVVGVAMLESSGSPPCIGDLLSFLSAVSFGIHMLRTERISRSTKRENVLPLLGYQICVVALLSTTWYLIEGWLGSSLQELNPLSWTWDMISGFPWIPALYTGIMSTSACLWVEMTAMRDVSATETAIIYGLEPVWGAGFAWFFLGERWGLNGWIGAALVLGGSLTVQIMGAKSETVLIERKTVIEENSEILIPEKLIILTSPIAVKTKRKSSDLLKK